MKSQKLQKSLFRASAHTGVGTPKGLGYFVERKAQRSDDCSATFLLWFPIVLPGTISVGSEAGRILKEGGFADSASLSRILAELLGGTRSSPPEALSPKKDRAPVRRVKRKVFALMGCYEAQMF